MATVFLRAKRKTFYHRAHIPHQLQPYLKGRQQLWRSLKTKDRDEAILRSAQWTARIQRLFLTLKKRGGGMTNEEREALVAHWLEVELDEAEDARTLAGPVSEEYRESIWYPLSDQFDEAQEALLFNNWRIVEREADELLKSAGLPMLDHDGADFGRLCRRLLLAKQEYLRIEADRWGGKYPTDTPKPTPSPKPPMVAATSPLFSTVVEKYMVETVMAARSGDPLKAEFLRFTRTIGGDKPIASITKADGRTYKEDLLNTRRLSMMTTAKHLSAVVSVFRWAQQQGYVSSTENPLQGLAPSKKIVRKTMVKRRPFTDVELLSVFGSQEFLKQRDSRPTRAAARYWLCLICLFSSCRREEAGQLVLADIQEENGIPFFRINDDAAFQQVLKNEGSRRRVPIHSELLKLGFRDYVSAVRAAGHLRLFPTLTRTHNGLSDPIGKWFSRLVTKRGLSDPALVLHSLRHGGIFKLHAEGTPHNIVEVLAGHAASGVHGRVYEHRELLPIRLLQEGLERLRYEEVVKALGF